VDTSDNTVVGAGTPSATRHTKIMVGKVRSSKMQKTVVVGVEKRKTHPIYRKTMRQVKTYKAHDENNECKVGDVVRIVETRPLSKEKRWRVVEILDRGLDLGPAGQA
jgi:small subunit ribosomal protein S17